MDIVIAAKLMELYAACPKCGCEVIGNGKGALECDTTAGFFRRICSCGWSVEVRENCAEPAPTEEPAPAEKPDPVQEEETAPAPEPASSEKLKKPPADDPRKSKSESVHTDKMEDSAIKSWNGFVHIRCEACHHETTICLRSPTTEYRCRECGHLMNLPDPYRAYINCECGRSARYLTNVTDWAFDIPCVACGMPNAVVYDPGKDCYTPASRAPRRSKARKKK